MCHCPRGRNRRGGHMAGIVSAGNFIFARAQPVSPTPASPCKQQATLVAGKRPWRAHMSATHRVDSSGPGASRQAPATQTKSSRQPPVWPSLQWGTAAVHQRYEMRCAPESSATGTAMSSDSHGWGGVCAPGARSRGPAGCLTGSLDPRFVHASGLTCGDPSTGVCDASVS